MSQQISDPLSSIIRAEEMYESTTKKASPALLEQISAWLWTKAEMELLTDFQNKLLPYFSSDSKGAGLFSTLEERLIKAVPDDDLSKALNQKMATASDFQSIFNDAKTAIENGQFDKAATLFSDLSSRLIAMDPRLPQYLSDGISQSLGGLLVQGKSGQTVGDLLFLISMAQKSINAKKAGTTVDLKSTIEAIADNIPPTPFAEIAQNLLALPNSSQLLNKLALSPEEEMDDLEKNLALLLDEINDKTEVKLSLATTKKMLANETTPSARYQAYLKTCEDQQAKDSISDLVKKLGFSNLDDMIAAFQTLLPYSPDMKKHLDALTDISKANIPSSPSDIARLKESLNNLFQALSKLSQLQELPPDVKQQFLLQFGKILDKNIQAISESELVSQKDISDLETQAQEMNEAVGLLTQFNQTISAAKEKGSLTFPEIQENIQTLMKVISNYRLQSQENKDLFAPFFDALQSVKINGKPLSDLVASGSVTLWLNEFSRSKPGGSIDQFKDFMKGKLSTLQQVASDHPFLGDLMNAHKEMLSNPSFPMSESAVGKPFMKEEAELLAPNPEVPKAFVSAYRPSANDALNINRATLSSQNSLTTATDQHRAKAKGIRRGLSHAGKIRGRMSSAKSDVNVKGCQFDPDASLADNFMNIIMKFMTGQSSNLEDLADVLSSYNDGVNAFNQILGVMIDFSGANKQLDLTTTLRAIAIPDHDGYYSNGSNLTLFQANIVQAGHLIDSLIQAISSLFPLPGRENSLEKIIENLQDKQSQFDPDSDAYKNYSDMINTLKNLNKSNPDGNTVFQDMIGSLNDLKSFLTSMDPEPTTVDGKAAMVIYIGTDPKTRTIMDIGVLLSKINNATLGDQNKDHKPPYWGSLEDIYQAVNQGVTNYSNMSQEQQIMLQMNMTTINQEWTLVATCMQTLYQSYHSLANAVFPH